MSTTQGGGNISANGLILYLDAANTKSYAGTGTVWTDLSRSGINGVLTNMGVTGFSSTNLGTIVFDGVDDYVLFGSISSLQFTNTQPFSISSWIKWTDSTNAIGNSFAYAISNSRGYYLSVSGGFGVGTNLAFFDYFDGTNYRGIRSNTNSITKNVWFNLVATNSNVNLASGMRLYLNGSQMSTVVRSDGSPSSINYNTLDAQIGARGGASSLLKGEIPIVSIYNRELSSSEVLQNYNATKGRFGL